MLRTELHADTAVFDLAAIAFEAEGACGWEFECGLDDFAVYGTGGPVAVGSDGEFVPVERAKGFEFCVRAREQEIAALELLASQEDTAVGIGRGAEF